VTVRGSLLNEKFTAAPDKQGFCLQLDNGLFSSWVVLTASSDEYTFLGHHLKERRCVGDRSADLTRQFQEYSQLFNALKKRSVLASVVKFNSKTSNKATIFLFSPK
jgi:hypothetical protein